VLSRGEGAIRQRHLKKFGVEPKLGTLRSGTKYLLHELRVSSPPRKRPKNQTLEAVNGITIESGIAGGEAIAEWQ
jgi:hypothetical protein